MEEEPSYECIRIVGCCLSPTLSLKPREVQTGGGGRGPVDRSGYGGDGSGRGDGAPNYRERLRRYRLGVAIALAAVVTLFVALSVAFLLRENPGTGYPSDVVYVRGWQPLHLPLALLGINTLVLALSSLTVELARRQAAERVLLAPLRSIPGIASGPKWPIPWLAMSIGLGCAFLAGQALAWQAVASRLDTYAQSNTSFFYILTGAHALHLLGGLLALLYAAATTWLFARPLEVRQIVVDTTAWYWHTMAALWVFIFALLALYPD